MKWTNHDRLAAYGVCVVGWPRDIPSQNPSNLTMSQNKVLLERLRNGSLHFARIGETELEAVPPEPEPDDDLSWVYQDLAGL